MESNSTSSPTTTQPQLARLHRLVSDAATPQLIALARFRPASTSTSTSPASPRRANVAILDVENAKLLAIPDESCHAAPVRSMAFVPPSKEGSGSSTKYLVTVADDKDIRLYRIPSNGQPELLGSKTLVKRANALAIVPSQTDAWAEAAWDAPTDESPVVLVADKFGDVYRLSLNDIRKPNAVLPQTRIKVLEGSEEGASNLIFGHVSMVTDISLDPTNTLIFTADRDEHIRITEYPKTYNIHGYLLGHEQYVSNFKRLPHAPSHAISGGGDPFLVIWDTAREKPLAKVDLTRHVAAKGGFVSSAEAQARALGLSKPVARPFYHPKRSNKEEEGVVPEWGKADDDTQKVGVSRLVVPSDGTVALILENFPFVIVYNPAPTSPYIDPKPAILDLNGVQPIDIVFDHKHRIWISTLEGPVISLWQRENNRWTRVESDPALDLILASGSEPLVAPSGKGQDEVVDFFPWGKIRKRIGEAESGDEGGDEDEGNDKKGKKRGKR